MCTVCTNRVDTLNQRLRTEDQVERAQASVRTATEALRSSHDNLRNLRARLANLQQAERTAQVAYDLLVTAPSPLPSTPVTGQLNPRGRVVSRGSVAMRNIIDPSVLGNHTRDSDSEDERPPRPVRQTRARVEEVESDSEEELGSSRCGVCLRSPRGEPILARCGRPSCDFQTCLACWSQWDETSRAGCPACRYINTNNRASSSDE
jgi:hypothetical protein